MRLEIESLLQWVYRDELPKQSFGGAWGGGGGWSTERIDDTPDYEHHTFPIACGPPHDDALRIDHAVRNSLGFGDATVLWDIACDTVMGDLANYARDLFDRIKVNSLALVLLHAQMGTRPPWDVGPIERRPVGGKQPKVFWPDGVEGSKRAGYYSPGAHCRITFEPTLITIAEARAEYFVWWQALDHLVAVISTLPLEAYGATPPRAVPTPWLTGETDKRLILPDKTSLSLIANHVDSRRLIPRRTSTTIGPPKKSPRFGPVRAIPIK